MVVLDSVQLLQPILDAVVAQVEYCSEIDQQRQAGDERAYAHVDHHPDVICVAHAFDELPADNQVGILLHEVGHLLCDADDEAAPIRAAELSKAAEVYDPERVPEEAAANQAVLDTLGIEIAYDDRQLQTVNPDEVQLLLAGLYKPPGVG